MLLTEIHVCLQIPEMKFLLIDLHKLIESGFKNVLFNINSKDTNVILCFEAIILIEKIIKQHFFYLVADIKTLSHTHTHILDWSLSTKHCTLFL